MNKLEAIISKRLGLKYTPDTRDYVVLSPDKANQRGANWEFEFDYTRKHANGNDEPMVVMSIAKAARAPEPPKKPLAPFGNPAVAKVKEILHGSSKPAPRK